MFQACWCLILGMFKYSKIALSSCYEELSTWSAFCWGRMFRNPEEALYFEARRLYLHPVTWPWLSPFCLQCFALVFVVFLYSYLDLTKLPKVKTTLWQEALWSIEKSLSASDAENVFSNLQDWLAHYAELLSFQYEEVIDNDNRS